MCEGYTSYQCLENFWYLQTRNDPLCGYVCSDGDFKCTGYDSYVCSSNAWSLRLTNDASCGYIAPLAADFFSDTRTGLAPKTLQFYDQSSGNPNAWTWNFGDGSTSSLQNPSHEYKSSGTYTVTLTIQKDQSSNKIVKKSYIKISRPKTTGTGKRPGMVGEDVFIRILYHPFFAPTGALRIKVSGPFIPFVLGGSQMVSWRYGYGEKTYTASPDGHPSPCRSILS
ncbi:MAG: PKD domain-containing protein [Methanomicrobiales archaeon]|nr:PKD domain-containing protein [Methanomicrobiales archaeon]